MATSGADIIPSKELVQEFENSKTAQNVSNSDVVLADEEHKQNTVNSQIEEVTIQTSVASNDLGTHDMIHKDVSQKLNPFSSQTTFSDFTSVEQMEQTMSSMSSDKTSNHTLETISEMTPKGLSETSQQDSPQRLQTLMQEFKSLLEDYQKQTLKLAKSFATITTATNNKDSNKSTQNLDLSAIGNVVIQQKDIDGYESGLAQLTQTLSTMESELEASLRKAEYQELSRKDLETAHLEMLERLASTSENRCNDTLIVSKGKHLDRVGKLCAEIAETMGCSKDFTNKIASSAKLHDIGKLAIPDSILQKPDRLDADEYATMKLHTIHGAEMLSNNGSEIVQMAQRIALTHHENWDGTGYPYQLKREEIALEGRIAAVADVYDALISNRIYKEAWPKEKAVEQIKSRSGTKFDPLVVEAFLKVIA